VRWGGEWTHHPSTSMQKTQRGRPRTVLDIWMSWLHTSLRCLMCYVVSCITHVFVASLYHGIVLSSTTMQASAIPLHSWPVPASHLTSSHRKEKKKSPASKAQSLSSSAPRPRFAEGRSIRFGLVHMGKERKGGERASVKCLVVINGYLWCLASS